MSTLKISIVLCAAVFLVSGENKNIDSDLESVTGETWVEIAARDSSLQSRASAARDSILEDISSDKAAIIKPYYEVEKLSNKIKAQLIDDGMIKIDAEEAAYKCHSPETDQVGAGLQNISYTESCVKEIPVGHLLLPSHMDHNRTLAPLAEWDDVQEQIKACRDDNCVDTLEKKAREILYSIPTWPEFVSKIIDVFPNNYEESVAECARKYRFYSIRDRMLVETEKRRGCYEKLIKDHITRWGEYFSAIGDVLTRGSCWLGLKDCSTSNSANSIKDASW